MSRSLRSSDATLLSLLADADCRRVVERLLESPATQRELRDDLGLQSGSLSRQMRSMEDAKLLVRGRSHGPYELTMPQRTRAVLQAAADLATELSGLQHDVDEERARSLRKGGMRGEPAGQRSEEA
jgi:DNA-binding MarR family transcriptional regulator